ncbi:Lys14p [Sugiyamaella lignohabitans]|uniref:Lys14p n=1 Tax=Sugiyamaella lignohabitans TaxID=796027 RepID=A0A167CQZ1_9ASCO|nr:Lys14p [Sugiyamaella lignohabitans]ANB12002.1 Lys14p [Sugiyamaella lignohabitans]
MTITEPPPFFDEALLHDEDWISHAGLLATNLNDLVSMRLGEMSIDFSNSQNTIPPTELFMTEFVQDKSDIHHNVPVDYIKVSPKHQPYLNEFYHWFAKVILPFSAHFNGVDLNPVRDVLLTYAARERYLLLALLACGATSSHKKTSLAADELAYGEYLTTCIQSLEPIFNVETTLVSKIESILLTVLVLTSDHASSSNQNWRAHLQGAKELLLKYTSQSKQSHVLFLCKSWYSSIELLAALGAPNGGTLRSDRELELLISPDNPVEMKSLTQLHLYGPNGFSLLHGYSKQLVTLIRDMVKLLHKTRPWNDDRKSLPSGADNRSMDLISYKEVLRVLSGLYQQLDYTVGDPSPLNGLSSEAVEIVKQNNKQVSICWYDVSNKSYTLAALITMFTSVQGLSKHSPIVQGAVKELLSLVNFLDGRVESYGTFMLQLPMFVAGYNVIDDSDAAKIERFFKLLDELGAGSANHVLKKMKKVWGGAYSSEAATSGDDEKDILAY